MTSRSGAMEGYVAGMMDGEGAICVARGGNGKSLQLGIHISNQSLEALEVIQKYLGMGHIYLSDKKSMVWKLSIMGRDNTLAFAQRFYPKLIVKRARMVMLIDLLQTPTSNFDEQTRLIEALRVRPRKVKPDNVSSA